MIAGATGFAGGIPLSVRKAFAIAPDPGTTWADAEHIVVLMQENRSFDHAFGTLQGVRGFNDPRAIRQANDNSIFMQTNANGDTYIPWRLDIRDTKITWMGSIPHSRNSQVDAWNHGHHNAWIDAKRSSNVDYHDVPITMGHYTREDIPFYFAMADAFTVCDQHYCSVMSSTTPNRSMLWTGTIRDEQKANSAVFMRNDQYHSKLKWKTFPERLSEAGVTWNVYQNEVNVAALPHEEHEWLCNVGNVLEHFGCYNVNLTNASTKKLQSQIDALKADIAQLQGETVDATMKSDHEAALSQKHDALKALQDQLEHGGSLTQLPEAQQELHMRAFVTNVGDENYHSLEPIAFEDDGHNRSMNVPKGDVLYQFREDVKEGTLPTVSWLVPPGKFSDHPAHPWYGAWFVSEAMDILTSNAEVWKKTIFILTYDENDGYFDHGPSYVAPDPQNKATGRASEGIDVALEYSYSPDELAQGVPKHNARSGPIGLGFRVPMVVASPWSRGGWVNSELCDHTSSLQLIEAFVEKKFGKKVHEENMSQFRRAICGDLTSCFRPADNTEAKLPFLDRNEYVESIQKARYKEVPSNYLKLTPQQMSAYNANRATYPNASRQEPGIRPSNALPYELYCEGGLSPDGKIFRLAFRAGGGVHGERSNGAPFNVYIRNTKRAAGVIERGANNQNMAVATFVVKPGDTMQEGIPVEMFRDGKVDIEVHAPNGFFRSFQAQGTLSPVVAHCVYERTSGTITGNVLAQLRNDSTRAVNVVVAENAYSKQRHELKLEPGAKLAVPLNASRHHGWYDYTVSVKGETVSTRFAGRVETGRSSFTDPVMGGVTV